MSVGGKLHNHLAYTPNNFKVPLNSHKQFGVSAAETIPLFLRNTGTVLRAGAFGRGFLGTKQIQDPSSVCSTLTTLERQDRGAQSLHLTKSVLIKCEGTVVGQKGDLEANNTAALWKQHLKL